MIKWDSELKIKAKKLREKGYSLSRLEREIKVPRSTIHYWLKGTKKPEHFTKEERLRWIKSIQPLGALANRKKHELWVEKFKEEADEEIANSRLDTEVKKSLLSILYWTEGNKTGGIVQFVNTDPRMVLLFITLLRECYQIDETKLRLRLHLHEYHDERKTKKFWSELLKIPTDQFYKTYRKERSKEKIYRKNFGGICFIRYNSTYLKEKLLQRAYSLAEKLVGKISVPVA